MRQGLHRKQRMALPSLAFVEAFCCGKDANREVRRLHESPSQIPIAALAVRLAFLPPVAEPLTVDTSAVGGKLPDASEAPDVTHLQSDGHGQDRADAGDGLVHPQLRRWLNALEYELLQPFDLHRERIDDRPAHL